VILYVEDRESECSFKQTCLFYRIFLSVFFILLNISVSLYYGERISIVNFNVL